MNTETETETGTETEMVRRRIHVVAVPHPSQGHMNPILQFCKRLTNLSFKDDSVGVGVEVEVEATVAITVFINKSKSNSAELRSSLLLDKYDKIKIDTISDGFDEGGFAEAKDADEYLCRMEATGSRTLSELIMKHKNSGHPVDCVVYDPCVPWALDVAKQLGIAGAAFFTQMSAVNYIYYGVYRNGGDKPLVERVRAWSAQLESGPIPCPGMPSLLLHIQDMPSFIYDPAFYPAYFHMILSQFRNIDKTDAILVNTFYELEDKIVDTMSKAIHPIPVLTVGPTIPSLYLNIEKGVQKNDTDYGLDLFEVHDLSACSNWLNKKPEGSVVYVSFGSMANVSNEQMEEIAMGIKASGFNFLWVVRECERAKLPEEFKGEDIAYDRYSSTDKDTWGLIVNWSTQLEVLSNRAVGCFFTHCGWNSTAEGLSLGVPMVGMPQWTDQPTDAKFVQDVWKTGIRVKVNEKGIVTREEVEHCIREVMESPRGKEMNKNAKHWRKLAIEAVAEGGSSHKNIQKFVLGLVGTQLAS